MLPVQVVLVVLFAFAASKVVVRYRAGELTVKAAGAWVLFWLLAVAVAISPNLTSFVAKILGVGRGADLVIYAALALLFYIVFRLMVKIEKLNREITKVVRNEALKK